MRKTGNEKQGAAYLQRLLEVDRLAGPYPLAGVFTAIALSQIAALSDAPIKRDNALAAIRSVLARGASIPNAVVTVRMARALLCTRDRRVGDCESELEFLEPFEQATQTARAAALPRSRAPRTRGRTAGRAHGRLRTPRSPHARPIR